MKNNNINFPRFTAQFIIVFAIILATIVITFTKVSFAQVNSAEEQVTQELAQQGISSQAYKSINSFFDGSPEISLQRYNQQLIEVDVAGRSFFASNDGRYVFTGKIFDTLEKTDITEQVAQKKRVRKLAEFDDKNQLTFPANIKELFAVTLFTDIDCGYCRRFHSNMTQYNDLGIRVNYVMLPRAGKHSKSYDKTAAVLCSENPQDNMTLAMQGKYSAKNTSMNTRCNKNLNEQMLLAAEFGISSTPSMILPSGKLIVGVLSPEQLLVRLQQSLPSK
ncbi:MAG: DsbC family protein [Colwellia sp.]|nr:DsbC family protein [Colwellia sp.]